MERAVMSEFLCIPGNKKHYAVEFSYVEQLFQSMEISPLPCLSKKFLGISSYRGNMIPILRFEGSGNKEEKEMIMVLKYQRFLAGVIVSPDTFVASSSQMKLIEAVCEPDDAEILVEKKIYQVEEKLFFLMDVEKTFENLILYP